MKQDEQRTKTWDIINGLFGLLNSGSSCNVPYMCRGLSIKYALIVA